MLWSKRPYFIWFAITFFEIGFEKSQYEEKFEQFNEHFKTLSATFGPLGGSKKFCEVGVFSRFLSPKALSSGFQYFKSFNDMGKIKTDF